MPSVRVDIISIGTLSRNRIWNETQIVRTAHATTSLVRTDKRNILIDPGLPPAAIGARIFERTGLQPSSIDTVFLTNFRPSHRAGLPLFDGAKIFIHEIEQEIARQNLQALIDGAPEEDIDRQHLIHELQLLESLSIAPDELADEVDLFPLTGYTPGTCGVLVSNPTSTTLIAGDGVPTLEHFLAGQVLPDAWDIKQAHESLAEAYEIADLIVPGHDNIFVNPRMAAM